MSLHKSKESRAFTLVEVLVVAVILVILAALLFPVFSKVKRQAKSITCLSNLRQVGVATQLYKSDNDDNYPMHAPRYIPSQDRMDDLLSPYGVTQVTYQCPDYAGPKRDKGSIDDTLRFSVEFPSGPSMLVNDWRLKPDPSLVIAFCTWNTNNPQYAVGDGKGGSVSNGFINVIRDSGTAERISTAKVKDHEEDWGGFGPDVDPGSYRWLEFPGETFPPEIDLKRNG
ncbi:hypothetical protein BH11ARM1_BH11ARM1_00590 [soil metagenome]